MANFRDILSWSVTKLEIKTCNLYPLTQHTSLCLVQEVEREGMSVRDVNVDALEWKSLEVNVFSSVF